MIKERTTEKRKKIERMRSGDRRMISSRKKDEEAKEIYKEKDE